MGKKLYTARQLDQAYSRGARHAALIADGYNGSTTHPYMLGDCILLKLNRIRKSGVRKNTERLRVYVHQFSPKTKKKIRKILADSV